MLVGVICYLIMQSAFSSLTQEKVRNVGVSVSKRLEETANGSIQSYLIMDEYIERESFENNVNIAVMTSDGDILLPIEQRLSDSEREYWAAVHESVIDRLSDFEGNNIQFVNGNVYTYAETTPFASAMQPVGQPNYLVVRYSLDLANNTMSAVQRYMIIVSIFVVPCIEAGSFLLTLPSVRNEPPVIE